MSNCQEWTAARPIPEGMTIFCLVSFTTEAVRSAMPATAGFLVDFGRQKISGDAAITRIPVT